MPLKEANSLWVVAIGTHGKFMSNMVNYDCKGQNCKKSQGVWAPFGCSPPELVKARILRQVGAEIDVMEFFKN